MKIGALIKKLLLVVILSTVVACQSPLSDGKLNDLSVIDAHMEIYQNLTNKGENEVSVYLYDQDGKPIRNKDIKLKVNSTGLKYTQKQELYYTETSRYSATGIPVKKEYNFRITLSNGKDYFLGSITPLAENKEKDIQCDEKGSLKKDFVISWNNLKDINELSITKSVLMDSSTKTQKYYNDEPVILKKIGSSGQYILPKSSYTNSKSTLSGLEIKFNALKFGTMNPQLIKRSEIKIFGYIDKRVSFEN